VVFLFTGIANLINLPALMGYANMMGVPLASIAVPLAMVLLIIGGFCYLTGYKPLIGVAALTLFFVAVTPQMHPFWRVEDPMMWQIEFRFFEANLIMLGLVWMSTAIPQPWPFRLSRPAASQAVTATGEAGAD
jgi:uncharacterized membrane protein YphA (DoxX/SURF4 family)